MRLLVLLVALSFVSSVHAADFGAWSTDFTDDREGIYAATENESGNLLGQYCFPQKGKCYWILGMSSSCKEGDKYPVLANSDKGAGHIFIHCDAMIEKGLYRYIFEDFDVVDNIVKEGVRVGFAIPLESDNFRVVRFDLQGSNRAIELLESATEKAIDKMTPTKPSGTRDQIL